MGTSPPDCSEAAARVARFFEMLQPENVADVGLHYAMEARFKDPFNDVQGEPAIRRIFEHMFKSLDQPRFVVTQTLVQGMQCFMTWEFHFGFQRIARGKQQIILGATHLVFDENGKIVLHRDYWDAAEELYEKLPLLGGLMRWLKRQAND